MTTKIITCENQLLNPPILNNLVTILKIGGILVLPTDTSYMLACDAINHDTLKKLFALKNRPFNQPVSACFSSITMAKTYVRFSPLAETIAKKFLPGPLTLVLPCIKQFPDLVKKNKKVGARIPATPVTLQIVAEYGKPLTATSANKSGGEEPYSVSTVLNQLGSNTVDLIVDMGTLNSNRVSTIAEIFHDSIQILRPGPISREDMEKFIL